MSRHVVLLIALGVVVVMLTRMLVRGIEILAASGGMSAKRKGQFLGYATSIPELVGTVGTAGNGLLGAGLWNVASSNIINLALFSAAAVYYRRIHLACRRKFIDEIGFALLAFGVPLLLVRHPSIASSPWTALLLFALFCGYLWIDRHLNPDPPLSFSYNRAVKGPPKRRGLTLIALGVLGIIITGHFLGHEAKLVVTAFGMPQWAVGWILGVITSLPEMTAFFAVFAAARDIGLAEGDDTDCQENLDSLAASNMSNLGLIYPIGIAAFLIATR